MKTRLILLMAVAVSATLLVLNWPAEKVSAEFQSRASEASKNEFRGAAEYYRQIRSNVETGEMDYKDYIKMSAGVKKQRAKAANSQKDLGINVDWQLMGPNNYGGRTRDISFTSDGVTYAGGVSGGLYKSSDNANTWQLIPGFSDNVNVSSVEKTANGTLYVGTGSSFDSAFGSGGSGFLGQGLYKSDDEGISWELVDGLSVDVLETTGVNVINELMAHHSEADRVWVGSGEGLFLYDESEDATVSVSGLPSSGTCMDLTSSSDGQTLLAVISSEVYKSTNGGSSWSEIQTGDDPGELDIPFNANRVGVAISPEDPDYMYCLISESGRMGGTFASTDGGDTWFSIWPANDSDNTNIDIDPFGLNTQGRYDLAITVLPNDKNTALVGGVTLWKCGTNTQPEQIANNFGFGTNYVHSDIHDFEWNNNELFVTCDGGIFKSNNILFSDNPIFVESNFGYTTTQFYGIGVSTTGKANGGTQDNSCFLLNSNSTNALNLFGGDGFHTEISKVDDKGQFVSSQYGTIGRSFDGGASEFSSFFSFPDSLEEVLRPVFNTTSGLEMAPFVTLLELHENTDNPLSQDTVIYANYTGDEVYLGDVVEVESNNMNAPFEITLNELNIYTDTIARDTFTISLEDYNSLSPFLDTEIIIGLETVPVVISDQDDVHIVNTEIDSGAETVEIQIGIPVNAGFYMDLSDFEEAPLLPETFTVPLIDRYTSLFALSTDFGIFVTRDAINANVQTEWANATNWADYNLNSFFSAGAPDFAGDGFAAQLDSKATCIKFSADGNEMYYGDETGSVKRVSGFNNYWGPDDVTELEVETIFNFGSRVITGISLDPLSQRIAISVGGYGGAGKVWYAEDASTMISTNGTSNFEDAWFTDGVLQGLPCYDVLLTVNHNTNDEILLVATEFGVWGTNEIGNEDAWEQCSEGFGNVPVFALEQQWRESQRLITNPTRPGEIFAGTHGKGLWRSGGAVGIDDIAGDGSKVENSLGLTMFPNPASDLVSFELEMVKAENLRLEIYSITGKLVQSSSLGNVSPGLQIIPTYVGDLSTGNYVVKVIGETVKRTGKLVVQN